MTINAFHPDYIKTYHPEFVKQTRAESVKVQAANAQKSRATRESVKGKGKDVITSFPKTKSKAKK